MLIGYKKKNQYVVAVVGVAGVVAILVLILTGDDDSVVDLSVL